MSRNERRRRQHQAIPEFAIEHDPDDPFVAIASGLLDDPGELIASVLDDLADLPLSARITFADQAAKQHSILAGRSASHISRGWRVLATLFFLEAFYAREAGNVSPALRRAIALERVTLRNRAGAHFVRAGVRLCSDIVPA